MNENVPIIDPRRSILLVMDYQSAIIDSLPDASALLSRISEVITLARSRDMGVGYVWVAFGDSDYDSIPETNKGFSQVAASRRLHLESPDTAIHPGVFPQPGDLIVHKTRVGAFSTTELHQKLRKREIDTLILAGIATSGVVLSTVRDAADRDYRLYVLEDCCADRNPDVHSLLMEKVFPNQAYVISVADLPAVLGD